MSALFYDYLIPWNKVDAHLDSLGITGDERGEIIDIFDETLHSETLVVILHHLPTEKHEDFLDQFHATPYDKKLIEYLKTHGHPEIEQRIRDAIENTIAEVVAEEL